MRGKGGMYVSNKDICDELARYRWWDASVGSEDLRRKLKNEAKRLRKQTRLRKAVGG